MQASKKIYELLIEKLQGLGWKIQAMSSYSSVLKSGAEMSSETVFQAHYGLEVRHWFWKKSEDRRLKCSTKPCRLGNLYPK
jgi:hypothetical protein